MLKRQNNQKRTAAAAKAMATAKAKTEEISKVATLAAKAKELRV